jgi:hypothetical protein
VNRREFFEISSRSALAALAAGTLKPGPVFAQDGSTESLLERRLAELIGSYDAQGNHRTGTEGDAACALWLVAQLRKLGVETSMESFPLSRVDPQSCFLRIGGRRIDGVPLFDGAFTDAGGIRGRLGPLGSDAEIGLAETEPFSLVEPRREQAGPLAEARRSHHKAVVLLTRGSRPGLFLLNAIAFQKPFGPPTLQVTSEESDWLKRQAEARAEAVFVAHVSRTPAQASNVVARISGTNASLPPLAVTTPYSGWWQCGGERGGGLACWMETIRALAAAKPERECLFVAFSGHEVGFLGIDDYSARRPGIFKRVHRWIHYGANIGAPHQPNLINASDDEFERWVAAALAKEGIAINHRAARTMVPRGEAGAIHRGGARYITVVCGTDLFHHAADRWPDAVDLASVARYAKAFANGALELAKDAV